MKHKKIFLLILIPLVFILTFSHGTAKAENNYVYLGGNPVGFALNDKGAYVVGLCDVITENGVVSPSKEGNICVGDVILEIDGEKIATAKDIQSNIKNKKNVEIKVLRKDNELNLTIAPAKDLSGNNRIGIFIRDYINGIGTVTYFTKNEIACLGHPVFNENKKLIELESGKIYKCSIFGVVKGTKGQPGELRGVFGGEDFIAETKINNATGIYGTFVNDNFFDEKTKVEIGKAEIGEAFIYSTISGDKPKKYSISIVKATNDLENKDLVIKIEDKELINYTGGIVQGMSGSPIVQNNKLVGAVTHVFINDPTRGFGININKMLKN